MAPKPRGTTAELVSMMFLLSAAKERHRPPPNGVFLAGGNTSLRVQLSWPKDITRCMYMAMLHSSSSERSLSTAPFIGSRNPLRVVTSAFQLPLHLVMLYFTVLRVGMTARAEVKTARDCLWAAAGKQNFKVRLLEWRRPFRVVSCHGIEIRVFLFFRFTCKVCCVKLVA
jgi:hypothetical protein